MAGGKGGGQGGRGNKPGSSRKGAQTGSGGNRRKSLEGKGPTPRAENRPHHPAARRVASAAKRAQTPTTRRPMGRAGIPSMPGAGRECRSERATPRSSTPLTG